MPTAASYALYRATKPAIGRRRHPQMGSVYEGPIMTKHAVHSRPRACRRACRSCCSAAVGRHQNRPAHLQDIRKPWPHHRLHQKIRCSFTPDNGPPENYEGHIGHLRLDLGVKGGGVMTWAVFAPVNGYHQGAWPAPMSAAPAAPRSASASAPMRSWRFAQIGRAAAALGRRQCRRQSRARRRGADAAECAVSPEADVQATPSPRVRGEAKVAFGRRSSYLKNADAGIGYG